MANNTQQAKTPVSAGMKPQSLRQGKGPGRPTTYTPATAELIAFRLADGETLTSICRTPGMPSRQTVHQWRMRIPAFADVYAHAREIGMETMSDDILTIADDDSGDMTPDDKPNSANVQRSRLQIDTRWRLMQSLASKTYGDKVEVDHIGSIEHRVSMSDRERMRRLATFLLEDRDAGVTVEGEAETLPDRDVSIDDRFNDPRGYTHRSSNQAPDQPASQATDGISAPERPHTHDDDV